MAATTPVDAPITAAQEEEGGAALGETAHTGVAELTVVVDKTDQGFGIFFTRQRAPDGESDLLVLDGFVEATAGCGEGGSDSSVTSETLSCLQVGDILVSLNGVNCRGRDVAEVLSLLRSAAIGTNTLVFERCVAINDTKSDMTDKADGVMESIRVGGANERAEDEEGDSRDPLASVTEGLMGALWKVKSKIKAEIDGDEEELLREQHENEQFEQQWLAEFHALKAHYEAKWETCTYTADEFCGLLYRSSNTQQQARLLQEYPTLMDAWKDNKTGATSSRVIPPWPAAEIVYENPVVYQQASPDVGTGNAAPRAIQCSHSLQEVLGCLAGEFMWRTGDVQAFSTQLERRGISSCSELLVALGARSGRFERRFQSEEYPRLSKTILRALRSRVEQAVATHEGAHSIDSSRLQVANAA